MAEWWLFAQDTGQSWAAKAPRGPNVFARERKLR